MPPVRKTLRFLLNDQMVERDEVSATETLLDYLRLSQRLTGTKEGCAEGDCGACTVLVGRLTANGLVYESVNACIRFTGTLDGNHIVTVEHLSGADGDLHPVQAAMVQAHGSQCGFCTPGFIMSLYGLWMTHPNPSVAAVESALQGNLCRCTGYAPIVRAAQSVSTFGTVADDPLVRERARVTSLLEGMADGARVEVGRGSDLLVIPADVDDLADVLEASPKATVVAGSTDVGLWVTKFMRQIGPIVFIGHLGGLKEIADSGDVVRLGAGVTYSESLPVIAEHFPQMLGLWQRIGGAQVRNMGTIGGNIANGSPIGDTPPPLIALGARVVLRKGSTQRTLNLQDYFIAYGKQDRQPGEFVEWIEIPKPRQGEYFAVYKISKRMDEDISALCGAFRLRVENGVILDAVIAFGGMAATPKRAAKTEAALVGADWTEGTIDGAATAMAEDFTPLTDMRASADYRMLAAQNLLRRFFLETSGEKVRLQREATQ